MEDKIIEHLSNEIQKVIETNMTFRTRITFIAWIGPFLLLSSLVATTKGVFRVPVSDPIFLVSLATFCLCYLCLGYIGALIEKEAWKRCDYLRKRIILYSKCESLTDISNTDINHPAMVQRIIAGYMWACTLILFSLFSVSIAISRIENKNQPQGSELTPKSVVAEKQTSPAPAFAAHLRFQGRPIEEFTSVETAFSLNNRDTGEKGIRPGIEYHEGRHMIQELVPGNYVLFISINANPDNPGGYPGYPGDFFYRDSRLSIPSDGEVQLSIDLQRVIHLTLPQDNAGVMEHWGERGLAMIAFGTPVEFAWDAVADGALYHFAIYRMQSEPFKYLDRDVEEATTQATRVSLDLEPSEYNEFYLFHLYATKGPFRIGELKTHGERGYGNDLRFRVK